MNRQLRLALIILGVALAIAALMIFARPDPEEKPQVAQAPLVQTEKLVIQSGPLQVIGAGTVQAREEVAITAEIAGKLVYVNPQFREGRRVGQGTVLFRINSADYENAVESARADVVAQDVAVLQAEEEVEIAKSELENFARRNQQLTANQGNSASNSQILPPRALANNGNAPAANSRNGAPSRLATREPQLRSARAARQRAGAQLADARLALSRTAVTAPFAGIIRSEEAAIGTLVSPGQQLGSLVATDAYEVRISLTEEEAALVPGLWEGQSGGIEASVTFAYGGARYRWQAYVDRADTVLDEDTRTIDIFLRVPNPVNGGALAADQSATADAASAKAPPLLLGSFVDAEIQGIELENYAAIPVSQLRPGNEIWLVRDGKLKIVPVRLVQRSDDRAYVTSPELLKGGAIITSNLRAPVDGMALRVESDEAPAKKSDTE